MKGQPSHACSAEKHRLEKVLGQRGYERGGRLKRPSLGEPSSEGYGIKEEDKVGGL